MKGLSALLVAATAVAASHAAAPPGAFGSEASKQAEIYNSAGEKVPEGYVIHRSLLSYAFTLSPEFRPALAALGKHDRWLDIGAGEGHAVLDYRTGKYDALLNKWKRGDGTASVVAMSIEDRRTPRWHEIAAADPQVRYVFGRRLREYAPEELGQFRLVTDVLGGFSYTRYPSVFMEQTLARLNLNGSLFTVLQDVHSESGKNRPFYPGSPFLTEIVKSDGSEMKVCEWLKSIGCVEVACGLMPDSKPPVETYQVRKVCNDVKVPPLALVHFAAGTPPERRFQLTSTGSAIKAGSLAELQRHLLGREPDVDLFRARGPFGVSKRADVELRTTPSERVKADVFLSAPTQKAPLVILLHGDDSSKEAHAKQAEHLASWGLHSLTVQLPDKGPWDVNGRTLARLVAFIQRSPGAIDNRIDTSRIILSGHSFGGFAVAVALAESGAAAGAILLDPAGPGKELPNFLRRIRKPVMVLGADDEDVAPRNRDYFFEHIRGGVAEVSIRDAVHEDAQYPSAFALRNGGVDPDTTEELQVTFVAALSASALSLAATGTFEYAWASFQPLLRNGKLFSAKRK